MATPEIRALLFDVGNVIVRVDFERVLAYWARQSGRALESLADKFTMDESYERHERGEIDASAYFESLRRTLGLSLSDEDFAVGWNAIFVHEIDGIREILERSARHAPLYAFSNTNDVHYVEWSTRFSDVFTAFDRVFVSCQMARRKPEREAYEFVTNAMGIAAEQVLFFDDSEENIRGAREAGMQAVHVRSIDDVRTALADKLGETW